VAGGLAHLGGGRASLGRLSELHFRAAVYVRCATRRLSASTGAHGPMRLIEILESPGVYRLWQAPFWRSKFAPVARHSDLRRIRRVLDVGCGPGTNAALFADSEYLGLDYNGKYIAYARRKFRGDFVQADARSFVPPEGATYDLILVNSFFHHIDDENVRLILKRLSHALAPQGHIHILDLVLPSQRSLARYLARHDRGEYPRTLDHWQELFQDGFAPSVFEPYRVSLAGIPLWHMVYFKGARQADDALRPVDTRAAGWPGCDCDSEGLGWESASPGHVG